MSSQEQAYKEALNELLEAYEKFEPIVQKAKNAMREVNQEEYIKTMEEQNRILKERIQHLEETSPSTCVWDTYSTCNSQSTSSFTWQSFIAFVIFLWVFLVFLGF